MSFGKFLIDTIDLYGLPISLRYRKKSKYNTICGFIFSVLTVLSTIIVLLFYFTKVLKHDYFSIIQNTEQLYDKKILNFSRVPLLIGFINDGGRPVEIDPKYIKITLDKNDHYPEKNKEGIMHLRRESTSIKLEYCDLNKHFNNDSEIIKMINEFEYDKYLCVVPGQNLSIAGRFGDSIHGYDMLEIHLIKCENTSTYNECASFDEIKKFYKNSYLSILYLSETLNHYDFHNPIRKTFRSEVFTTVSNSVKRYYYYFAPGEYYSHNGYFFSNMKKYEFFDYQKTVIDFVDEEEQSYYSGLTDVEISFSCSDIFIVYKRKYSKIQDCFGSIAGWIRIILIIANGISDFFSEKIFLLDMINTIFPLIKFDKTKTNNINNINNINNNNDINKNFKNNNSNIVLSESSKNKIISSPILNKKLFQNMEGNKINYYSNILINIPENFNFTDKKKVINLSICEYCLPFFLIKKKEKFKSLVLLENFIYKYISIEVIIPLFESISKLTLEKETPKKEGININSKLISTVLNNNFLNENK